MNIALVTYALKFGGVETYIETLASYFISHGHTVEIIETVTKGQRSDDFRSNGYIVRTQLIHFLETENHFAHRLADILNMFDVVLLNYAPFVQHCIGLLHDHIVVLAILHNDKEHFYNSILINYTQINKIICVSLALEKKLLTILPDPLKITSIISGVPVLEAYVPKEKKSVLKILYAGRIDDEQKGVFLLPRIIHNIALYSENFVFNIVGEGPSRVYLERMVLEQELNKYINFLGPKTHEETLQLLFESNILIMPSYYEGLGLVYLEAMGQGTIPIVSRLLNNTDLIIENGINGFLCEIGNADSFSNAVISIMDDQERSEQIALNAWQTAKKHFSQDVMGERYLNIITEARSHPFIVRTKKIEAIPYGSYPSFLAKLIQIAIKVKLKLFEKARNVKP